MSASQAPRLRSVLANADYLDFHEYLWQDPSILDDLVDQRALGTTRNPNHATSYILPTWLECEFKRFCEGRRILFCGAEAPLLEELLKHSIFRDLVSAFWPDNCTTFFLRPREDGRNLGANLDLIKQDLIEAVKRWQIDTLFLALGGGAKILCFELAKELGICAIDFGSFMRSFTYSGSQGNRNGRATHLIFLNRVPFGLYMDALEKTFPDLTPEALLAKAHAQLLLKCRKRKSAGLTAHGKTISILKMWRISREDSANTNAVSAPFQPLRHHAQGAGGIPALLRHAQADLGRTVFHGKVPRQIRRRPNVGKRKMSEASSDKAQLINAHTGLRGIASMNVFIAHVALMDLFGNSNTIKLIIPVFFWHIQCVDLFFYLKWFCPQLGLFQGCGHPLEKLRGGTDCADMSTLLCYADFFPRTGFVFCGVSPYPQC